MYATHLCTCYYKLLEDQNFTEEYNQDKDAFLIQALNDLKVVFPEESKLIEKYEGLKKDNMNSTKIDTEAIQMIWTAESNIYKNINKAMFLDIFASAFSGSDDSKLPVFLRDKSSRSLDYEHIITNSYRYIFLLNKNIQNGNINVNSTICYYRGIKSKALK